MLYALIVVLVTVALVVVDQVTKYFAVQVLYPSNTVSLWDGVLEFCYTENRGVAWGLMQDKRWIILVITGLTLLFLLGLLLFGRLRGSKLLTVGGTLVLAGGLGNLIDRVFLGYVIDFIHYYKWFDFPVFNFADCCVTVGAVFILVYVFFFSNTKEPQKEETDATVPLDTDGGTDGESA